MQEVKDQTSSYSVKQFSNKLDLTISNIQGIKLIMNKYKHPITLLECNEYIRNRPRRC